MAEQDKNDAMEISIFIAELNAQGIEGRAVFEAVIARAFPDGIDWETLAYIASQFPALSLKVEEASQGNPGRPEQQGS